MNRKTKPSSGVSKSLGSLVLSLLVGLYVGIHLTGTLILPHGGNSNPTNHEFDHDGVQERRLVALQQAYSETELWKSKAETLQKDYTDAIKRIHLLEHTDNNACREDRPSKNDNNNNNNNNNELIEHSNPHAVCQHLSASSSLTPTALSLWTQNINAILVATKHPNDNSFKFHDFTTQLLQILTPRLYRSVKTLPHEWVSVERVMTIAWERYHYLQLLSTNDRLTSGVTPPPRPLKILVMGGSLLVGTNCRKLLTELGLNFRLPNRECTWSHRLMLFLNSLAKNDVVEVTKVAMGGTNTATGNVIWQYDLIPEEARNPDIVINAYSTNDMHILTILEAQSSNVTLRDKIFEMTQEFVRNVLHTCDPKHPPPLLLHVDDYLGNEQHAIWDTTELSQAVQVLANYYGFVSISYADVVREIVYGDTKEAWLSANWWATGSFEREIHPGMGMHIASTWVIAYNLLHLVTTFCSLPQPPPNDNLQEYTPGYLGLPSLNGDTKQADNKPKPHPKGLPPALTKDLLIEDVTKRWQDDASDMAPCDPEKLQSDHRHTKCPFSWVSGLSLQQNNQTWIKEYFESHATTWDGWVLSNDGGKLGFTPTSQDQTNPTNMVLEFTFVQTIRSVTLFFMKSYGEKWKDSQLQFQVTQVKGTGKPTILDGRSLSGIHAKETSEMYTEDIQLSELVPVGTKLRAEALLTGGSMFKIMGLAMCS